MLSAILSILIFAVPIIIFLVIQAANGFGRGRGHWPQPKQRKAETASVPRPRRRARVRVGGEPSCGRHATHFVLALLGARDSCRECAALRLAEPTPSPTDVLAEAERIVGELQD